MLDAEIACADERGGRGKRRAAAMTAIRGEPYHDERTGSAHRRRLVGPAPAPRSAAASGSLRTRQLRAARDAYNAERDAC